LEIKKLFGINSVNLDIWNRLSAFMVREGPLFATELAVFLVYPYTKYTRSSSFTYLQTRRF
jgi:hypothetical protein